MSQPALPIAEKPAPRKRFTSLVAEEMDCPSPPIPGSMHMLSRETDSKGEGCALFVCPEAQCLILVPGVRPILKVSFDALTNALLQSEPS